MKHLTFRWGGCKRRLQSHLVSVSTFLKLRSSYVDINNHRVAILVLSENQFGSLDFLLLLLFCDHIVC